MPGWARRTRTVPWQHRQFLIAERGGRESSSTSRCRELYIHEMFLLSSHLNVTCLPIPFFFHFFQPPNSQVFRKHMKKTWFCVLHAASVSTTGPGWESIREAAMAQKGVTLCAMSLGNETDTTLVGGLGSGGEHCCLLKVPDICRDCMLLMTFTWGFVLPKRCWPAQRTRCGFLGKVSVEAKESVLPEPEEASKRMKWMAPFFGMGFLFTIWGALNMNLAAMYTKVCSKAIDFIDLIQLFLVIQWGALVLLWCRSTPKKRKYKKTESLYTKTHRFREEVTFQSDESTLRLGSLASLISRSRRCPKMSYQCVAACQWSRCGAAL